MVDMYVHYGAEVNAVTDDGATAVMKACAFGTLLLVQALFFWGASATMKTLDNSSIIHFVALKRKSQDDVETLVDTVISEGANIYELDGNGRSALSVAFTGG